MIFIIPFTYQFTKSNRLVVRSYDVKIIKFHTIKIKHVEPDRQSNDSTYQYLSVTTVNNFYFLFSYSGLNFRRVKTKPLKIRRIIESRIPLKFFRISLFQYIDS